MSTWSKLGTEVGGRHARRRQLTLEWLTVAVITVAWILAIGALTYSYLTDVPVPMNRLMGLGPLMLPILVRTKILPAAEDQCALEIRGISQAFQVRVEVTKIRELFGLRVPPQVELYGTWAMRDGSGTIYIPPGSTALYAVSLGTDEVRACWPEQDHQLSLAPVKLIGPDEWKSARVIVRWMEWATVDPSEIPSEVMEKAAAV